MASGRVALRRLDRAVCVQPDRLVLEERFRARVLLPAPLSAHEILRAGFPCSRIPETLGEVYGYVWIAYFELSSTM